MSKNEYETIINPSNSLLQNSANIKHIIQKDGFQRCLELIIEKLALAKDYEAKENFDRYHEAITVNGERGTGKTSFILSIQNFINGKSKYLDSSYEEDYKKVKNIQTLKLLDPTLLSDRQKILLTIISNISELVESELQNCPENSKREWKDKLFSLAEGLNSIINIGSDPNNDNSWDDAGLILENGLLKAKAGINFEENFHEFIEKSLIVLKKDAFLLILDDIDTNFEKGWDVLETLRKYITTPKIITIISGDLTLYKQLIRSNQLKLFKEQIKYEESKKEDYIQSIDELESQYLIKILKPENYINLYRLNYFLSYKKENNIGIQGNNEEEPIPLKDFFIDLLSKGFSIQSKIQQDSYFKILTSLPLRTNIQMFRAYFDSEVYKSIENQKYFLQKVKDIFITLFTKYEIDLQFFEILREESRFNVFLSKFFVDDDKLISSKDLISNQTYHLKEEKNLIILILKSLYNAYSFARNDKYLEWGLKVILLNNFISKYESNKDLYSFLELNNDFNTENRILKLIGLNDNTKNLFVVTYRDHKYSQGGLIFNDFITNQGNQKDERLLLSKVLYTKLRTRGRETKDTISFFYILSFIEELYSIRSSFLTQKLTASEKKEFKEKIEDYLQSIISSNYRFILSKSVNEEQQVMTDINELEVNENESYEISSDFIERILKWLEEYNQNESTFTLDDITIAFNNFINKYLIDTDKFKNIRSISEYLQISIYTFLNEVLKRSLYKNIEKSDLNTITIEEIGSIEGLKHFISNLEKYNKKHTKTKIKQLIKSDFFFNIVSCPIWNYYIKGFDEIRNILELDSLGDNTANYDNFFIHKSSDEKLTYLLNIYKEKGNQINENHLDEIDNDIIKLYKNEYEVQNLKGLPNKTKRKEFYEQFRSK